MQVAFCKVWSVLILHFVRFFNVCAYKMKVREFGIAWLRLDAIF